LQATLKNLQLLPKIIFTLVFRERQRYEAETDGRRKPMKWEEEPRDRRRDGCDQKPFCPATETLTGNQSEYNNKAGENRDQANQGVNDGVDLQYHIIAASVSC
jgi:hypothetical protein